MRFISQVVASNRPPDDGPKDPSLTKIRKSVPLKRRDRIENITATGTSFLAYMQMRARFSRRCCCALNEGVLFAY